MQPGSNGAKKLTERYGSRLVCVRYRYDPERKRRLKTVELIEEDVPWIVPTEVDHYLVKIAYEEEALREKVKTAGAEWVRERRLWRVSGRTVRHLALEDRVVDWIPSE